MKRLSHWIEYLVKRCSRSNRRMKVSDCLIIFSLYLISWLVTYYTGGSKFSFVHVVYMPIIYAALSFKIPGGFLGGILAGIVMGPLMPLDVQLGLMQNFY